MALSPDGGRAVASRTNPQDASKADLWLFDLSRGSAATRLTLGTGVAESPVWSSDGKRIAFTFSNSLLQQKLATGEGDEGELWRSRSAGSIRATDWSLGRQFLYAEVHRFLRVGISCAPPRQSQAAAVRAGLCSTKRGRFSPNGRWVGSLKPVRPE